MGCPKALVDSERIMTQLRSEGYDLVGSYHDADLVIVNTCGFLNEAVAESVEAIEEAMRENGKVIVTGCLGAKRHLDGTPYLTDVCPGVVGITGPGEFQKVYDLVHSALPAPAITVALSALFLSYAANLKADRSPRSCVRLVCLRSRASRS